MDEAAASSQQAGAFPGQHVSPFSEPEVQRRASLDRGSFRQPILPGLRQSALPGTAGLSGTGGQLTLRAVVSGILIGSLLCCSNMYFGLQTGWVTMGSLQSAILGFGMFRLLERYEAFQKLSMFENVIIQTTAVATATMPLAAGLVGIVPALGMLTPQENPPDGPLRLTTAQLLAWSAALAFIGVFLAVPLRAQTILREKLRFPSGTATANVIRTLHGIPALPDEADGLPTLRSRGKSKTWARGRQASTAPDLRLIPEAEPTNGQEETEDAPLLAEAWREEGPQLDVSSALSLARGDSGLSSSLDLGHDFRPSEGEASAGEVELAPLPPLAATAPHQSHIQQGFGGEDSPEAGLEEDAGTADWAQAWAALMYSFGVAGAYSLLAGQVSWLKTFPVFSWLGWVAATRWGWDLTPSTGYIGQGMIMGPRTAISMLAGAIVGYGILGPLARARGWAPGPITDWKDGATGWILWVSLAIMLGDSLTSLSLLLVRSGLHSLQHQWREGRAGPQGTEDPCPPSGRVPTAWWLGGLFVCGAACTGILSGMLQLPVYEPVAALALAAFVAVLAVRALGETDMNPVSGVGKLSQVVFALVSPGRVVPNLVAGAVAEAGAQQAGDMMQDFKTAHLLGVCPRSQFLAMLIGSAVSVPVSVAAYTLYTNAYQVPGPEFPAPTASIWLDMAQLVNGGKLPEHVLPFCAAAAGVASLIPPVALLLESLAERRGPRLTRQAARLALTCLPSGISFAVGMYVAPRWTVPRVLGSLAEQVWQRVHPASHGHLMVVVASGLVLGEGTAAILTASVKALLHR